MNKLRIFVSAQEKQTIDAIVIREESYGVSPTEAAITALREAKCGPETIRDLLPVEIELIVDWAA